MNWKWNEKIYYNATVYVKIGFFKILIFKSVKKANSLVRVLNVNDKPFIHLYNNWILLVISDQKKMKQSMDLTDFN